MPGVLSLLLVLCFFFSGSAYAAVEIQSRQICGVAVVGRGLGRWEGC